MLSKEEIENKIKPIGEMLQDKINRLSEENFKQSQYIDQLESDKQKLIEKLEEESKQLDNDILTMSIDTGNEYSLKLIHQAEGMKKQNDRILSILKGENQVTIK